MDYHLLHTPEGVRDIYGQEFRRKLRIEEKIHKELRLFGYEDIQTPMFEYFDVFSKEIGTTSSRELYKFFDKEGDTLVLRPDFTPPMARCAAKYFMHEDVPLRFCYSGSTFINTSNLQGKLKEVTQMGVELLNDDRVEADGEVIALVIQSLIAAGLKEFQLSIGQIEFFKGLCEQAGLDEETELSLRDFISEKNIFGAQDLLLSRQVNEKERDKLLEVTNLFGSTEILAQAKELTQNKRSLEAIQRLEELYRVLCSYGVEGYVSFDLGMLSKYHYYTGIIFKGFAYGTGDALVKGGRYNNLLKKFGKDAPAVGFVIVIDDLMQALAIQKADAPAEEKTVIIEYSEETYEDCLKEAVKLRKDDQKAVLTYRREVKYEL